MADYTRSSERHGVPRTSEPPDGTGRNPVRTRSQWAGASLEAGSSRRQHTPAAGSTACGSATHPSSAMFGGGVTTSPARKQKALRTQSLRRNWAKYTVVDDGTCLEWQPSQKCVLPQQYHDATEQQKRHCDVASRGPGVRERGRESVNTLGNCRTASRPQCNLLQASESATHLVLDEVLPVHLARSLVRRHRRAGAAHLPKRQHTTSVLSLSANSQPPTSRTRTPIHTHRQ